MTCGRYFSARYLRAHHGKHFIIRLVNTYFDTRGSYRRTSKSVRNRIGFMQLYRIVDKLGEGCKSPIQAAKELHPRWSGMLGLDTKVVKVRGEERYLLIAVDIVTQDIVDSWLAIQESLVTLELFLKGVRDEIGYMPKLVVIDLDQTWREAVESVFLYVPIQLCVVHFERIVDRIIPRFKRTPRQMELKQLVRDVLYAPSLKEARYGLDRILQRRGYFRDRKSRQIVNSLKENFELLATHFGVEGSFRTNNAAESVNDKLGMKLWLIRGYKRVRTARNSLKLMVMHYRFNPFSSCKIKEHNGKSPLDLAGVRTSRLNWVIYSQKDPSTLNQL